MMLTLLVRQNIIKTIYERRWKKFKNANERLKPCVAKSESRRRRRRRRVCRDDVNLSAIAQLKLMHIILLWPIVMCNYV